MYCCVGDVLYWIFSSGAQTLSDSSLRASEPTTAVESSGHQPHTINQYFWGTWPFTEDMSAEDASMTHRECSFPYFSWNICFAVYGRSIAVRVTSLRALQWQTAQPCFTECFTNVRVNTTQGDTGSVACPICILHSYFNITVFRISSLCKCSKYRQFLKQKKTLAVWHQHCSAAASRSSNATKTALERIWSLRNHNWLRLNDRGNYI